MCWSEDEAHARKVAHELWAAELLPGQLNQELALPKHFQEGASLATEDMVAEKVTCGPDPERHLVAISAYLERVPTRCTSTRSAKTRAVS